MLGGYFMCLSVYKKFENYLHLLQLEAHFHSKTNSSFVRVCSQRNCVSNHRIDYDKLLGKQVTARSFVSPEINLHMDIHSK